MLDRLVTLLFLYDGYELIHQCFPPDERGAAHITGDFPGIVCELGVYHRFAFDLRLEPIVL